MYTQKLDKICKNIESNHRILLGKRILVQIVNNVKHNENS